MTGGGSGVGAAIALALAGAGVDVTICGRRDDAARKPSPARATASSRIAADVTDEASMAALLRDGRSARAGPFDIVVANAGMADSAPAHRTTLADWQRTLDVNLTGAFLTVKPALAGMAERGKAAASSSSPRPPG